ncbi:MAG: hypothetical protein H6R04_387 [Burkholderiaceae bacterium]|nr:hypothetical protein [Burkholderiaceae bacterium]
MNIPASDASIPVLTQVLDAPPPKPPARPSDDVKTGHPAGLAAAASAESASEEWAQIERVLNERVLRQMQGRIDFVLEHRVKDGLAEVLQKVSEELTVEIRRGLQATLADIVARAIAQEIARLQARK